MARAEAAAQIAAAKKEEEERAAAQAAAEAKAKAEAKKTYTAEVVKRDLMGRVVGKAEKAEKETKPAQKENKPAQTRTQETGDWRQRGNGRNCTGSPYPRCTWYDAMAYCGGGLPNVAQLQNLYRSECTGGRKMPSCDYWFWSSESTSASDARHVRFNFDGEALEHAKGYHYYCVRCAR